WSARRRRSRVVSTPSRVPAAVRSRSTTASTATTWFPNRKATTRRASASCGGSGVPGAPSGGGPARSASSSRTPPVAGTAATRLIRRGGGRVGGTEHRGPETRASTWESSDASPLPRPGRALRRPRGPAARRSAASLLDFGLDQPRQRRERLLPAEIARLERNDVGHSLLHDVHLRADGHLPQGDRHPHLARQARVVEPVGVADALGARQLEILPAERVALAGREVRERHPEGAADPRVQVVHLAREPVRGQPLDHRVRVEEGPVDLLGRSPQHAVKPDGVARHRLLLSSARSALDAGERAPRGTAAPPPHRIVERASPGSTPSGARPRSDIIPRAAPRAPHLPRASPAPAGVGGAGPAPTACRAPRPERGAGPGGRGPGRTPVGRTRPRTARLTQRKRRSARFSEHSADRLRRPPGARRAKDGAGDDRVPQPVGSGPAGAIAGARRYGAARRRQVSSVAP